MSTILITAVGVSAAAATFARLVKWRNDRTARRLKAQCDADRAKRRLEQKRREKEMEPIEYTAPDYLDPNLLHVKHVSLGGMNE